MGIITIAGCLLLGLFTFWAGYVGGSRALLVSSFYYLQDFIVCIFVYWSRSYSVKKADDKYPYGYGKLEYLSTSAISLFIIIGVLVVLFVVGVDVFMGPRKPTMLILWSAIISCIAIYIMASFLKCAGEANNSPSVVSNSHHLHMHMISSTCLVIAITLITLGLKFLDPLVAIAESIHIIVTTITLFREANKGLMDTSLPEHDVLEIRRTIMKTAGVKGISFLRTREMGSEKQVDCEILLDGELHLDTAESIKTGIRRALAMSVESAMTVNLFLAPENTGVPENNQAMTRIEKVAGRYYDRYLKSHRLGVENGTIVLGVLFNGELSFSIREIVKEHIINELKTEIPETDFRVNLLPDKPEVQTI